MPKETFHNLTKEKREKIIKAAIDEFGNHSYQESSIARIIKMSAIPRGSFYQYFDNKFDLYHYILDYIKEKKLEYFKGDISFQIKTGFFDTLSLMIEKSVKFTLDNTDLAKVGVNYMKETAVEPIKKMMNEFAEAGRCFYRQLIKTGIDHKEIRKEIDIEFAADLLTTLMMSVSTDYITKHSSYVNIEVELHKILDFLKFGMGTREELK